MKKLIQKFASVFATLPLIFGLIAPAFVASPVYAAGEKPQTAILGDCAEEEAQYGNGAGIKCVVLFVVNILSVLVGIVGVIGIVVVGIQYLTAGGSEEQTRKAKRRLFEIIIGIAAYILIASLLNWLLPNYSPGDSSTGMLQQYIASHTTIGA